MGSAKNHAMEIEDKMSAATEIAIRVGLLRRCEQHEYVVVGTGDHVDAYKLGNHLITTNDPLVESFHGDRKELTDTILEITKWYGTCPGCEKLARE